MKLVAVNVASPEELPYRGSFVQSSIRKKPVDGVVALFKHNLSGDRQADLSCHGGEFKAVCAYSLEHYQYWQSELSVSRLPYGQFGENFTIDGADESELFIGDQLRIGSALVAITEPRVPCYKLGVRMGNRAFPNMFIRSSRTGFYLRVLEEGAVQSGDSIVLVEREKFAVSVRDLFDACYRPKAIDGLRILQHALRVGCLSPEWQQKCVRQQKRLVAIT